MDILLTTDFGVTNVLNFSGLHIWMSLMKLCKNTNQHAKNFDHQILLNNMEINSRDVLMDLTEKVKKLYNKTIVEIANIPRIADCIDNNCKSCCKKLIKDKNQYDYCLYFCIKYDHPSYFNIVDFNISEQSQHCIFDYAIKKQSHIEFFMYKI